MPIYTYRCPKGHEWDELRSIEGSEVSTNACQTCSQEWFARGNAERHPVEQEEAPRYGQKVPSRPAVKVVGGTPIHYPNRGAR